MKIFLQLVMMGSVIVGMIISKVNADETSSSINDARPDQMKIIVDVWPKEFQEYDCYYVVFSVENLSTEPIMVYPHDWFDSFYYDASESPRIKHRIPGIPYTRFSPGSGVGGGHKMLLRGNRVAFGNVVVLPSEIRTVVSDRYIAEPGDTTSQKLREQKSIIYPVTISNLDEKYLPCFQQPFPEFKVTLRSDEERLLLSNFLHRNNDTIGWPVVTTQKGTFSLFNFFTAMQFGIASHVRARELPTLAAWQEFEEKLSPGTFRDEIRLGCLQVQWLDGQEETALDELREWFAEMHPIQSMTLAASLCLPEGQEEEWEKEPISDAGFVYMPTYFVPKEEVEAHREASRKAWVESQQHYRAMRRAFDEVVRPYNTLPKRKLREKSELE